MRTLKILTLLVGVAVTSCISSGCTSGATQQAIQQYQKTEQFKELNFNNAYRVADQQMLLNLQQYVTQHPSEAAAAIKATWEARRQLEEDRVQFILSQCLTRLTVGQYLYNQQGFLNVWIEDKAKSLSKAASAAEAADKTTGIKSVKDLFPTADSTTQPSLPEEIIKLITPPKSK